MLVLTRNVHEKIIINDNIIITVLETWGERVSLGIIAPKSISIKKNEIYEHNKKESQCFFKEKILTDTYVRQLAKDMAKNEFDETVLEKMTPKQKELFFKTLKQIQEDSKC